MKNLQLRGISSKHEQCVRSFFHNSKDFGPEDVDILLSNIDKYASKRGSNAVFEQAATNDLIDLELRIDPGESLDRTSDRIFSIRRQGKLYQWGKSNVVISGYGPYYLTKEFNIVMPPNSIKITPAIMNTEIETIVELLRNLRIILNSKNPERVREARFDLEEACKGSRIGFVDFYSGRRFEIFEI